jgi:hypothetical protein
MGEMHMTAPSGVVGGAARLIPPEPARDSVEPEPRSHGMDGIREVLSVAREAGLAAGNFRGLLHIAIGRKIVRGNGTVVSTGVTWRELATELKYLRFDPELVRELGTDPDALAARDRERFWYSAITLAKVDSREAAAEADKLAPRFGALGYHVGPPPGGEAPRPAAKSKPPAKPKEKPGKPGKKKPR